jgi:nucleoside 2-deoxyribosyltransferase
MRVFISSSLKNRQLNKRISEVLEEHGFEVYLPQRDTPQSNDIETVFRANIEGIKKADVVVAILINYGRDLGFEVGSAYVLGKPIIGLINDESYKEDKMIAGALNDVVKDLNELMQKLKRL